MFQTIHINDLRKLSFDSKQLLIDLRSPRAYTAGHIPYAVNLPFENWQDHPASLNEYHLYTLYLYCEYGNISLLASRILTEAGYTVINLYGGVHSYRGPLIRAQR